MKKSFIKKYDFYIVISTIALLSFIFSASLSNIKSLWYDDIYQIYFSWGRSLLDTMKIVLEVDLNPPLWAAFSHFWLKVAPYGTGWLKLPSIVFVSMSIFVVGLTGKELFGKKVGIFSSLLFALVPMITIDCAYSFRAYGLYLFASAFIVYAYVRKIKYPSVNSRIVFAFAVFLIAFTHYFGALICVFLGISDLILVFLKKQKVNFFIEYVSIAIIELFWFIPQLTTISSTLSSFWPSKPTFISILGIFKFLIADSFVLSFAFLAIGIFFIRECIIGIKKDGFSYFIDFRNFSKIIFIMTPIVYVIFVFICSTIKPDSSIWVYRYFVSLCPMLILFISSVGMDIHERLANRSTNTKKIFAAISLLLIAVILVPNYFYKVVNKVYTEYEPFEQAAEIIVSRSEVVAGEDVLVINTTDCGSGWNYYLSKNGSRDISNIKTMDLLSYSSQAITEYDTIYLFAVHFEGNFSLDKIREEISQTHIESTVDIEKNIFKYERIK